MYKFQFIQLVSMQRLNERDANFVDCSYIVLVAIFRRLLLYAQISLHSTICGH